MHTILLHIFVITVTVLATVLQETPRMLLLQQQAQAAAAAAAAAAV
jgi:hypothetical protein